MHLVNLECASDTRVCSIISFKAILCKIKAVCLGKKPQIPKGMEGFFQGTESKFCVKSP